jgi:2-keto-myo-inositol isomerase
MPAFALNHMTVARMGFVGLIDLARDLGCVGVELRNDLPQPLFDGLDPGTAGQMVHDRGLRLLALAEVKRFNDWSDEKAGEAGALMAIAKAAGAEAVSLIPRNDGQATGNGERQANLRVALKALKPMLEDHDLIGMVEPLGFPVCALRYKSEAVEAIESIGGAGRFRLVHDTFHHHLAHGGPLFPDHTGIIHISGVTDPAPGAEQMTDAHRVLVDGADRLGNVEQIAALTRAGCTVPLSFEAFAPQTHALADPRAALAASMQFIRDGLATMAA